jgi:hypothetical protein
MHTESGGSGVCRDGQRNPGSFAAANGSGRRGCEGGLAVVNAQIAAPNNRLSDTIARARGGGCAVLRSGIFRPASSNTRPQGLPGPDDLWAASGFFNTRGNSSAGPPANPSIPRSGCVTDATDSYQICGMKTAISMNRTVRPGESPVRPVGGQNPSKEADYRPRSNQLQRFGRIAQCRVLASPAR